MVRYVMYLPLTKQNVFLFFSFSTRLSVIKKQNQKHAMFHDSLKQNNGFIEQNQSVFGYLRTLCDAVNGPDGPVLV